MTQADKLSLSSPRWHYHCTNVGIQEWHSWVRLPTLLSTWPAWLCADEIQLSLPHSATIQTFFSYLKCILLCPLPRSESLRAQKLQNSPFPFFCWMSNAWPTLSLPDNWVVLSLCFPDSLRALPTHFPGRGSWVLLAELKPDWVRDMVQIIFSRALHLIFNNYPVLV